MKVQLPIDVVPERRQGGRPYFKWHATAMLPGGNREMPCEGYLPTNVEMAVEELIKVTHQLIAEVDTLKLAQGVANPSTGTKE